MCTLCRFSKSHWHIYNNQTQGKHTPRPIPTAMSRASKVTLAFSCVLTAITVVGVHYVQELERDTLHQGPIKDAKRIADRKANLDPEKERKKLFNKSEHELQQELRKKYESVQPLSGEVLTKNGEKVE
ncbi:LANO_0B07184g1_1 [Lachancea nothofagi CBS 11611]|uniref:LANO_0B07184g1_1 n=1 Tax=Lachancea nothofagi CBS 11611 TaxID=1266666 RepID=A0A1G4IZN0_9SACH|nr:LANO_0B07184g1_1 [Lachancea nothofagi CBS 11611]